MRIMEMLFCFGIGEMAADVAALSSTCSTPMAGAADAKAPPSRAYLPCRPASQSPISCTRESHLKNGPVRQLKIAFRHD
jgi:hypothetical protein